MIARYSDYKGSLFSRVAAATGRCFGGGDRSGDGPASKRAQCAARAIEKVGARQYETHTKGKKNPLCFVQKNTPGISKYFLNGTGIRVLLIGVFASQSVRKANRI